MAKPAAQALVFMLLLSFSVHLKAQDMSCLGKADDPKQDFYAKKLNNIINYNNAAAAELAKLEKKNKELAADIDYLALRKIPTMIENLKQNGGKIGEALAREIAVHQAQYMENRAKRETELTRSNQAAERALLLEQNALLDKEKGFHATFEKEKRALLLKLAENEIKRGAVDSKWNSARQIITDRHSAREKTLFGNYERNKGELLASIRAYEKKRNEIELVMQKAAEKLAIMHDEREAALYSNYERDKSNLSARVSEYNKKLNLIESGSLTNLRRITAFHEAKERELFASYERNKSNLLVNSRDYENIRNGIDNRYRQKLEALATQHRLNIEKLTNRRLNTYDKKNIEAERARYNAEKAKLERENQVQLDRLVKPTNETITQDFENAMRQEQGRFDRERATLLSAKDRELAALVKPSNETLALNFQNALAGEKNRYEASKRNLEANKQQQLTALVKPSEDTLSQNFQRALEDEKNQLDKELSNSMRLQAQELEVINNTISKNESAITSNNESYARNLRIIDRAKEILEKKKEDRLVANEQVRDQLYNADYKAHVRKIADYKKRLSRSALALVDEMMEATERMNNKAKEMMANATGRPRPASITDAMYEASPEKYLQYQGIDEIRKNLKKFQMIALWWKEQGSKNDGASSNEAGVLCGDVDCEKRKKSPLEVLLLKKSCIEDSITHKSSSTDQIKCNDSASSAGTTKNMCVTKRMADYTHWSLNNALKCLSSPSEPIDPQLLFRKLNNESTFRFFYSYVGGQGLMQTINIAQNEVLGLSGGGAYRSQGRKNLADVMANNPKQCNEYKSIFDFRNENRYDELAERVKARGKAGAGFINELVALRQSYPKYNRRLFDQAQESTCDFVSLEAGIHRNILSGMGLFLHYRNLADADLQELAPDMKKNREYNKMRDLVAFVYYGPDGPGGGKTKIKSILPAIKGALPKMTAAQFEQKLKGIGYVAAMQNSEDAVAQRTGRKMICAE